jgi:hypothetical protein
MENPKDVTADSVNAFATAYENYAKDAIATSGGSFVSANKTAMVNALLNIPTEGTASEGALLFATAISYFWVGAILTPSTVTATFVPATLASALEPLFSDLDPEKTYSEYATDMASPIHTSTLTVATYNSGSSTPGVLA